MIALIDLAIYLAILGCIVWLLLYVIDTIPMPEPVRTVARVVIIVVFCLLLIKLLLVMIGPEGWRWPALLR
jgi:hypothetical protein